MPHPIVFNGPRTEHFVSRNPGPVDLFMLVLLPEALHLLTGLDISKHTNRSSAFDQVFDVEWQAMAQAVHAAPDHAARIALIEAFIEPRWNAARANKGLAANWLHDYLQSSAMRLVTSDWARSVRQLERRVKTWSGFSLQRLSGFRRKDQQMMTVRAMLQSGSTLAEVAADTGYADQAHFCREIRKHTGLTPKELARRVTEEESYWPYRIWS